MFRVARVRISVLAAAFVLVFALLPLLAHAQTSDTSDLKATIRAQLLLDPRSAQMPPAEFDAMVSALTEQAQKAGMTAKDIKWRPQLPPANTRGDTFLFKCDPNSFMCSVSKAFGLDGGDLTIPIGLGISSALLVLILGTMMAVRHKKSAGK